MKKVMICDGVHQALIDGLHHLGFDVLYEPTAGQAEAEAQLADLTGLIVNSRVRLGEKQFAVAPKLKFAARLGSGLDIFDLEAAKRHQVEVINSPEGNRNAVAEHALGMLLMLLTKLRHADASLRSGEWSREPHRGRELMGLTVGILGFGNTGRAFAEKLQGLGVRVIAYDKYKKNYAAELDFVEEVSLEQLKSESDVLSLHTPLTEETRFMVDSAFISELKRDVILINTSRGKVLKLKDAYQALLSELLGGLCLDVFEDEPPKWNVNASYDIVSLFELPNVVVSPHVAGWTTESKRRIADVLVKKISEIEL